MSLRPIFEAAGKINSTLTRVFTLDYDGNDT